MQVPVIRLWCDYDGSCAMGHTSHESVEWCIRWVMGHKIWPIVSSVVEEFKAK